jgi:Spy/CpxP family protein refolding chaperone
MKKFTNLIPVLSIVLSISTFASVAHANHHNRLSMGNGERIADVGMNRLDNLNLSAEQKTKIEQLKTNTRTQIEAILTPEQRQKFTAMKNDRSSMKDGWESLNLTADQKSKIQAIRQTNRQQLQAILTPAQQAQIKESRGNWSKNGSGERLDRLNLTADQKTKVEQLKTATRTQMEAVLTAEQRQKVSAMLNGSGEMRGNWKSLDLTADQKSRLKAIRQKSQEQFTAILTPEQQSQLKSSKFGKRFRSL